MRSEMNVPPSTRASVLINSARDGKADLLRSHKSYVMNLANLDDFSIDAEAEQPEASATAVVGEMEIYLPLADLINLDKERERLQKEIQDAEGRLQNVEGKLSNPNFVEKAPAHVVEKEREKQSAYREELEKLRSNYEKLTQMDSQ